MSIESEINRINNNVSDALAATAEKGATVPEGATSDNLGTLIRSIPTGGSSLPPLRIRLNGTETSISWGLGEKYTAAELYEIAGTRDIVVETRGLVNSQYLYGYYRYSRGTETVVDFDGWYETPAKRRVPASMQINASGNVTVIKKMFAEGTLVTDTTLNVSGSAADSKTVGTKFKEISEQIANIGSGGGSINVTAKVGQTIVVKEVDADGKPTAWEAADHQPRTHWTEVVEILPETTIEVDPNGGELNVLPTFELVEGNTYSVMWNGVKYDCVAQVWSLEDGEGGLIEPGLTLGNVGAMTGNGNTGEPFAVAAIYPSYVEMVGASCLAYPLDGSETFALSITREIAHKIPKKYVPTLEEMRAEVVEILPETTIPIDPDGGENMIPVDFALEPNKPYTIKYNGVEYADCVGVELEGVLFGNLGAIDESFPATNHPFILGSVAMDMDEDGNTDYMIVVMPLDGAETVTLSIAEETVYKIPQEYISAPTPYYVYDIPFESFKYDDTSEYYYADIDVVPVALLEAMYLRKPIYLRVIEAMDSAGATEYMACATWGCGAIDMLWAMTDKTLEFVPADETFSVFGMQLSAFISNSIRNMSEFYVRFVPKGSVTN